MNEQTNKREDKRGIRSVRSRCRVVPSTFERITSHLSATRRVCSTYRPRNPAKVVGTITEELSADSDDNVNKGEEVSSQVCPVVLFICRILFYF